MRKVKKVFAALLLLFMANTLMAQSETYTLKGNLKDANDGAMMPYTNCVLLHSTADLFDRRLSLYLNANDIFKSRSTGTGSLNPYHSSSYNYSFNSRYISLGLTWRIGRMELEEKASQSRVMKQH